MASEKVPKDPSRRRFLKYGLAYGGAAAIGLAGYSLFARMPTQNESTSSRMTTQTITPATPTISKATSSTSERVSLVEDPALIEARARMVKIDLIGRNITDGRVLEAMGVVPRQMFVDESLRNTAYDDHPLPIGEGQTISQPYVVALMTQSLRLKGSERVMEIGTGSGYQAAVLSKLVREVYTVEIREKLADSAAKVLSDLGYVEVYVKCGDGYFGWVQHAPFDAIMITCAVNHIPPPLIDQLKEGGLLILPLGSTTYYQTLTLVLKEKNGSLRTEYICDVRFLPMIGEALKQKTD